MDRAPSARVGVDAPAIVSTTAVLSVAVTVSNPRLSRLFHLAAPAANQQQSLAHRLLSQPDPEHPSRQGNAAAASVDFLREPARRPGDPPWAATRAGPSPPVSPVLSGRDQASATPSIAILHPLTGSSV
jgi:hypothetical protein